MKTRLLGIALTIAVLVALMATSQSAFGSVFAFDPTALATIGGIGAGDMLLLKYADNETIVTGIGQNLFGVGTVTNIYDATKDPSQSFAIWSQGQNGQGQLGVIFNNFVLTNTALESAGTVTVLGFTGGNVNIYYNPTNLAKVPTPGTNANPDGSGTYKPVGSTLWLGLDAVTGIEGGAFSSDTLVSRLTSGTAFAAPSGNGHGLFAIDSANPGSEAGAFKPGLDLNLQSSIQFSSSESAAGHYPVLSQDPLTGTSSVPEPTAIVIWALLGFGGTCVMRVWRRRGNSVDLGGSAGRQPWRNEDRTAILNMIARGR